MKKIIAALLAIMMVAAAVSSMAAGLESPLTVTVKSAMESALGDDAEAVSSALDEIELSLRVNENGACLVAGDTAVALDADTAEELYYALNVSDWESWTSELAGLLDADTSKIKKKDDVYNSVFTTSRYLEPDTAATTALLDTALVKRLFIAANEDLDKVVSGMKDGKAELTYYVADNGYLMLLDLSVNGEDMLIKVLRDTTGFSAALYIDTKVKDWDDTTAAIENGESGRGVAAFLLSDEDENYVEATRYTNGTSGTWEVTIDADQSLDLMVRVDGKKYMELEGELAETDADTTGVSLDEAASAMDEDAAKAVKAVAEALKGE